MKKTLALLLISLPLLAKVLVSPVDVMKSSFPSSEIHKKNILLKAQEFKNIQTVAKVKMRSKIFKVFTAKESEETLAYGILINRKVRSKNAVVLYVISPDSLLKSIEIIAFNEPLEYMPSQKWEEQFQAVSTQKNLHLGQDIVTITGATLSARTITDGSRLAFAFYNEILKDK